MGTVLVSLNKVDIKDPYESVGGTTYGQGLVADQPPVFSGS